jgi:hypothetical protein
MLQLKLHTLGKRRYNYDTTFHMQVYLGSKFCPPLLEAVGLPSARCASAASGSYMNVDVFGTKTFSLNYIL